jgi:hypothetical protein
MMMMMMIMVLLAFDVDAIFSRRQAAATTKENHNLSLVTDPFCCGKHICKNYI